MESNRGHVELINQLEEARGGNGGDVYHLNQFMDFIENMSDREIAKLDAYADTLKEFVNGLMEQRGLKRVD
ncbi:hypothetical protein P4639_21990 [Priestia megaterium]|uniref:hypothetical protein n=1 Tax=Priestia megaterium TaxID=1404 RepID=UPI002E1B82AE|nr:hypothetical protein [Priestia megaterium]